MNALTTDIWSTLQTQLGSYVPPLLGTLAILLLGWLLAVLARAGARQLTSRMGVNAGFQRLTGHALDLEGGVALALFWVVLLFTLAAVFAALDLALVSGPFASLLNEVFSYLPRLVAGGVLALLAWLLASAVRLGATRLLARTTLDERLAEQADMAPISEGLSRALFWLVILMFVPAVLGALQMDGLLDPLREMVATTLAFLPNVVAALVVGGVGWIVATVLKNLSVNLLQSAGCDALGQRAGVGATVQLSRVTGTLVFIVVFVPALIAALDALQLEAISRPATDMLGTLLGAVPQLIAAALILLVTWMVASFAASLLASLLASLGFDRLPARVCLGHAFEKTPASVFAGRLALFFAMLFATVEAAGVLGFAQVGDMVSAFIRFGGDILLGSVILVIGFWLANLAHAAVDRASGPNTQGLASVARGAILVLVMAMGLRAMGIADEIVNLAFGLTLGAVAVAVALAFGLGGREAAGELARQCLSRWR